MDSSLHKPEFFIDIFLQPGEFYFGDHETRIRTLLGSCVAITMWHPRLRIGGMCHYLLPMHRGRSGKTELDGRGGCRKSRNSSFSHREKVRMRAYKSAVCIIYSPHPSPLPRGEGAFTTASRDYLGFARVWLSYNTCPRNLPPLLQAA
jgi:hypothetical protein